MKAPEFCPVHTDIRMVVRPSGSVNGGSIGFGCAICNLLEIERLRADLDRVTGSTELSGQSIQRFRDRNALNGNPQP